MSEPTPSLPTALAGRVIDRIAEHFGLEEVSGPSGPHMTLTSPMSPEPVGHVRVLRGGPISRLVNVTMTVPPIGLDSHMVFAFTGEDDGRPHFTVDAVKAGPKHAFHLDLVPRADLGANLAYMDAVYGPLTEVRERALEIDGLERAQISPRQWAVMSPWMMAHRTTEQAFVKVGEVVDAYLGHWIGLVDGGLPAEATEGIVGASFAERDRANRSILFDPEVDPVWSQVDRLLGTTVSERIRGVLKGEAL